MLASVVRWYNELYPIPFTGDGSQRMVALSRDIRDLFADSELVTPENHNAFTGYDSPERVARIDFFHSYDWIWYSLPELVESIMAFVDDSRVDRRDQQIIAMLQVINN